MALAYLAEICPKDKIILLPAAMLLTIHTALYGLGGLMKLLPESWTLESTVLTAMAAINTYYAIALMVGMGLFQIMCFRRHRRRIHRVSRTIDL